MLSTLIFNLSPFTDAFWHIVTKGEIAHNEISLVATICSILFNNHTLISCDFLKFCRVVFIVACCRFVVYAKGLSITTKHLYWSREHNRSGIHFEIVRSKVRIALATMVSVLIWLVVEPPASYILVPNDCLPDDVDTGQWVWWSVSIFIFTLLSNVICTHSCGQFI